MRYNKRKEKQQAEISIANVSTCKGLSSHTSSDSLQVGSSKRDNMGRLPCTRTQGYLFVNDIKMCTGICLGDVPSIQNEQYTIASYKCN